ncbi:MAG: TonB-dependent receptor [Acidobacteriota bacterium]
MTRIIPAFASARRPAAPLGLLPLSFLTLSLLTLGFAPPLWASECAFEGVVVTGEAQPVAGAVVQILGGSEKVRSDEAGNFCLAELQPGRHALLVVAEGFSVLDASIEKGEAPLRMTLELTPAFGEEVVVTGTRTAKRLLEVPVHVQQVSRESIEAAAARTLADAIELTPGVRIESNCQNCNFSQVRLLGLEGPYSQILVDGQPTVSSLALVYGVEQFPARMLDSVEVVKGGGAAIYGAGSVGGVINLIPHAPFDTRASVDARYVETGGEPGYSTSAVADWSPGDRRTGVSVLAQLDDLEPSDRDGDGFTEVTSRELLTLAARAEHYTLQDQARLHGEVNWTEASRRGGDLARINLNPALTALTEDIDTERLGLGLGWLHTVSSAFDYRVSASYANTDRDSYYGAGFDPNAFGTTQNPLWIVDTQANWYHRSGTFTGGAQYSRDELDDAQPGYGRQLSETYTNLGLYLQDDRALGDQLTLVYGLRADDHSALEDAVLSPRLALMYSPREDLTLRFSFAQGFRAPVVFDEDLHIELAGGEARVIRPVSGLVEERSTAWLSSLEWRPSFGRKGSAALEVSAFRTDLEDLFDVIENDDPLTPERDFVRVNAEGAEVQGVELSLSMRWGSAVSLQAGYVFQSSRFDEPEPDFGSRDFFRSPDQHGTLALTWRLPQGFQVFVGARYTGPMVAAHFAGFIPEDRLETTPSFLEVDLNVSRDFQIGGRTVAVTLGAKNLTDEYQEDLDQGPDRDSNYVYGPRLPRSYTAGFRWDF